MKHVHVPADVEAISSQKWCDPLYQEKLQSISALLAVLPPLSSVVITSANTILAELFTHHGKYFSRIDYNISYLIVTCM